MDTLSDVVMRVVSMLRCELEVSAASGMLGGIMGGHRSVEHGIMANVRAF